MKLLAARFAHSLDGLSGQSIAIMLALGLVLGTFPVYGCPTLLCLLAAPLLRLNAPALQLVNQLASPLQLAMLIPFAKLGARILGASNRVPHGWLSRFSELTAQAIAGWFCIAVPVGVLLFVILSVSLRLHTARLNEMELSA